MDATALPASTDVAVVGAGPTGLTLAATLASAGLEFVVLDKLPADRSRRLLTIPFDQLTPCAPDRRA